MILRTALLGFLIVVWTVYPAVAGSCEPVETQLAQVSRDLARGQSGEAEQVLGPIEGANAGCSQLLLARARIQAAKGDATQAEDFFVRYTNLEPDDPRGYAYYAAFLVEQREYQRADAMSVLAINKSSNDPAALAIRGHILDMKGQSQEGMNLLEKACELDPENGEAQFQLGAIYHRAKRFADGVGHFEKAVAINPRDARAWDYLALELEPLGELDRAEKAYAKGLEVNERDRHFDAFMDYNYGRFLTKRSRFVEAKKHLDRAVELVPQIRATWYERAKLNLRLQNYQEARSDAERAAGIADRAGGIIDLQIYVLLEQVYRRLGETDLAQKYAALARETTVPLRADHR